MELWTLSRLQISWISLEIHEGDSWEWFSKLWAMSSFIQFRGPRLWLENEVAHVNTIPRMVLCMDRTGDFYNLQPDSVKSLSWRSHRWMKFNSEKAPQWPLNCLHLEVTGKFSALCQVGGYTDRHKKHPIVLGICSSRIVGCFPFQT